MVINEEVKEVLEGSAFLTLVTVNVDGTPHPIIAGKGQVVNDTVVFGIYKMVITQKNLMSNKSAWVVGATKAEGAKGYRLTGTAEAKDKQLIFTPTKIDVLL
ncbi:MAG TPA: pyridoxamine 5'-phosphate oxidase family protein [Oscillospiraceae bacterium]|nr:pyridoxamine 5'-phosphate oxidase family protein [Oscillospiraceae bacterium]